MFIPLLIYPLPSTATGISSIPYILNKLIFRIPLSELLEFRKLLAITKKAMSKLWSKTHFVMIRDFNQFLK